MSVFGSGTKHQDYIIRIVTRQFTECISITNMQEEYYEGGGAPLFIQVGYGATECWTITMSSCTLRTLSHTNMHNSNYEP